MRRYTGDALGRLLRLPPPSTEFDVHRGLRVPMRDGVDLIADHYVPTTPSPAGTVLVRGPYGRGWPFSALFGAVYAARRQVSEVAARMGRQAIEVDLGIRIADLGR